MSISSAAPVGDLDDLTRPLPILSAKGLRYGFARGFMATVGRLSQGIRTGWEHGFDSGEMLDYVYENRARGTTPLGRLIDRAYLDAPGWAGIRNRGALLHATIRRETGAMVAARGPVALADLACGGGRYVLDALGDLGRCGLPVAATLRDYRPENVARATANARQRGVAATIEQADAFDDTALEPLSGTDLVIVSGLHEIVADDTLVSRHLAQIADLLPPHGRLILTVQPDHPQLEFIARVLVSHTGRPWAMRLRPLHLTEAWLSAAGLGVERLAFEPSGIFGVLVARKG